MTDNEIENYQKKIEHLSYENNELHCYVAKMEDELRSAYSEREDLRRENQFLQGQIDAYKYCIENIR